MMGNTKQRERGDAGVPSAVMHTARDLPLGEVLIKYIN